MHRSFALSVLLFSAIAAYAHAHNIRGAANERHRDIVREIVRAQQEATENTRQVIARLLLWPNGSNLTVCYYDGDTALRKRVATEARGWLPGLNLSLDFGQDDARTCTSASDGDIRVGFIQSGDDAGYWSDVGTLAKKTTHGPTLNLDDLVWRGSPGDSEEIAEFRGLVLHEFGHALGLEHEHQNRRINCVRRTDVGAKKRCESALQEAVRADRRNPCGFSKVKIMRAYGWDDTKYQLNMRAIADSGAYKFLSYDPKSIMHYYFEPELMESKEDSPCYIGVEITNLSAQDIRAAKLMYPKLPDDQVGISREVERSILVGLSNGRYPHLEALIRDRLQVLQ